VSSLESSRDQLRCVTESGWPFRVSSCLASPAGDTAQMIAVRSLEAEANLSPPWLNWTCQTSSLCPSSFCEDDNSR